MKKARRFQQLFALLVTVSIVVAVQSCGKSAAGGIVGNWKVVKATADTSIHTPSGLDAVVTAAMMSQGATMTFAANDSLTLTMPPDNRSRVMYYNVLPDGKQFVFVAQNGRQDTVNFSLAGDTLTLVKRLTIKLTRGSM